MTCGPSEMLKDPSKIQRYFKVNYNQNDLSVSLGGGGVCENSHREGENSLQSSVLGLTPDLRHLLHCFKQVPELFKIVSLSTKLVIILPTFSYC